MSILLADLAETEYHSGTWLDEPSLSVSGAKRLLDCPARFDHERRHPPEKKEYDFGHAAHKKILGIGLDIVACPPDLLSADGGVRSAKAKAWVAEARAGGRVVIAAKDMVVVDEMATAIEAHPEARELLTTGAAEQSFAWRDEDTEVMLRGRADRVTTYRDVPMAVDYKTTTDANPAAFRWEAGKRDYVMQDAWYREGLEAVTGAGHGFLFVVQEKTAPYLVSVVEIDDDAREVGAQRNRVARRVFLDCTTTGHWPGYPGITPVTVLNARPA